MEPNTVPNADEISKAQNVFQRAADAILQLGELRSAVAELQQSVHTMQSDLERLRNQNNALEEALTHSRTARQELEGRVSALIAERGELDQQARHAASERDMFKELAQTYERERDEARERNTHDAQQIGLISRELDVAHEKLATLQESFSKIFGQIEQPKATPTPQPDGSADLSYSDRREPVAEQAAPVPAFLQHTSPEPTPAQPEPVEKKRIYEGEPGFTWQSETTPAPQWDEDQRRWFIYA